MSTKFQSYESGIYSTDTEKVFYASKWKAQTFLPSISHKITSVFVKLTKVGSGDVGTVTLSIRLAQGSNKPTGIDLCSATLDSSSIPTYGVGDGYLLHEFDLGDGTIIEEGVRYSIVCRTSGGDAANYIVWWGTNSDAYADGRDCYSDDSGSNWTGIANYDLYFAEYGDKSYLLSGYTSSINSQYGIYGTTNWAAQTFKAHKNCTVDAIRLLMYAQGSPGTVTVGIRATSGGEPTGVDLAAGTLNGGSFTISTAGEQYTFMLDSPLDLEEDTQYAIVVHADSGNGANSVNWKYDSAGLFYFEGRRLSSADAGSSWTGYSNSDFQFKVFGTSLLFKDYYNIGQTTYLPVRGLQLEGQTFTPDENYDIAEIYLLVGKYGSPGTLTYSIQETTAGKPNGSILAQGTVNASTFNTIDVDEIWEKLEFDSPVSLVSGTMYAIVLALPTGDGGNLVGWRLHEFTGAYSLGTRVASSNGGSSWTTYSGGDLLFETYSAYIAPVITDQSTDTTVDEGDTVNLYVTATGVPDPTYQWYKDDEVIPGEVSDTLSFISDRLDVGTYKCIVTNEVGSDTSDDIILTIQYAPEISSQSGDTYSNIGVYTTISVTASGVPSPTYQWYKDDIVISGATNSSYSFYMSISYAGTYKCVLTNVVGSIDSDDIEVILTTNPRIFNPFNLNIDLDV